MQIYASPISVPDMRHNKLLDLSFHKWESTYIPSLLNELERMNMTIKSLKEYEQLSPFEVKNKLIELASKHTDETVLNAGRGNPNWICATPRQAFFTLGQFAVEESKRRFDFPHAGTHASKASIAQRFEEYVHRHADAPGITFLHDAVAYGIETLGFDPDSWVLELVSGAIGDYYPTPERMLMHVEQVVRNFLIKALCSGQIPPGIYDLFATEGGTAGMRYCFDSLIENKLLHKGDKIALGSPIFAPYLEIPHINDFGLVTVEIKADPEDDWQYPDSEIDKLKNPSIKAFFVVNPGNPSSKEIRQSTLDRIAAIVKNNRPDLIILTDDVYGTFVDGFHSLMSIIPSNTLCVYSFSKHFGCTGWRVTVVALHEDNVLDKMIAALPESDKKALIARYASISVDPTSMTFIDRMVADSRSVALKHTAGLSLPQQTQMALFALFFMLDASISYINGTKEALNARLHDLYQSLGLPIEYDPAATNYYATVDVLSVAQQHYGNEFAKHLEETYTPLSFVFALAEQKSIVVLPGGGFDAPTWSVRVS